MNQKKQRQYRLYQAKHRGSRRSYKTELEDTQLLLAWEAAQLSEGQMASLLDTDRLTVRKMRDDAIAAGMRLADALLTANVKLTGADRRPVERRVRGRR